MTNPPIVLEAWCEIMKAWRAEQRYEREQQRYANARIANLIRPSVPVDESFSDVLD